MTVASPTLLQSDSLKDRIISLLGQNIAPGVVAANVGVSASYISQLCEAPEVREAIEILRAARIHEAVAADSSVERVEKAALERLEKQLPYSRNPLETARIFHILNTAKRKSERASDSAQSGDVVTITLPKRGGVTIAVNSSNQVIDINGRSMAPLPSRALNGLAERVKESAGDTATDVQPKHVSMGPRIVETTKLLQDKEALIAKARLANLTVVLDGVSCVI